MPDPDDAGVARGRGGVEVSRDYSGWLASAEDGDRASEVTVRLSFGERSVEPKMRRQAPEDRDPLAEGVSTTLESIRRQQEEGAGKVDPHTPPAGTEPQTGENPAVVDEDR